MGASSFSCCRPPAIITGVLRDLIKRCFCPVHPLHAPNGNIPWKVCCFPSPGSGTSGTLCSSSWSLKSLPASLEVLASSHYSASCYPSLFWVFWVRGHPPKDRGFWTYPSRCFYKKEERERPCQREDNSIPCNWVWFLLQPSLAVWPWVAS